MNPGHNRFVGRVSNPTSECKRCRNWNPDPFTERVRKTAAPKSPGMEIPHKNQFPLIQAARAMPGSMPAPSQDITRTIEGSCRYENT